VEQFGVLTLGSRLKRLSDDLFSEVQSIYLQCDIPISSTYFPILRLLQHVGGLSVVEIAERLRLSHPAVSKQVTKMTKECLLEKTLDAQDQRRSLLKLSEHGIQAMHRVEPILEEMKVVIENMTNFSSSHFMEGLSELEKQLFSGSLADKVMDRLGAITIVPLAKKHERAFYDLNMAWLKRYFPDQITEKDHELLSHPQREIIDKGGRVWVAIRKAPTFDSVVGAIAFVPSHDTLSSNKYSGEVCKLGVAEHCQGRGVAQGLLSQVFEFAEHNHLSKLTLETASCLTAARRLYDKNGFVEKAFPYSSPYERADVYMEKSLGDHI